MELLILAPLRDISSQIDRIINALFQLMVPLLSGGDENFFVMLSNTIMNSPYLIISVSLVLIGFVIGIIKRMISM